MHRTRLILTMLASVAIFLLMEAIEPTYISLFKKRDLYTFLNAILAWGAIKYLFLGLALGAIFHAINSVYSKTIMMELKFERKLLKTYYVLSPDDPKPTIDLFLKHSYLLFAPIVIGVRLFSSTVHMSALELYLFIGAIVRGYIWLVFLVIVAPYITLEYSRLRLYNKKKQVFGYPSYLMSLLSIAVLGAGSIASLVPLYYDLLAITHDQKIALNLFIYGIAIYLVPAIFTILGVYTTLFLLLRESSLAEGPLKRLAIAKIELDYTIYLV